MASSLARRWAGALLVLAVLGGPRSRAQDPAPAPPPSEMSPEELLRSHELKRSGSTWILPSETTVLKDLRDARALYRQVEEGMMRRRELEMGLQARSGMLEQIRLRTGALRQRIDELDRESSQLEGAEGNVFAQQQRAELGRQRNALAAEYNQYIDQGNRLEQQAREQSADQDPRLQLNAEVAERREKFMQALLDMRESVNKVQAKYEELARNQDVTRALEALSQSTKIRQKLGPSRALLDAIKLLEKSEGTVKTESITLLRESGVFHVMATLSKTPTRMVFDTGAGLTTISANLAKKVGVRPAPGESRVQLRTADGSVVDGQIGLIPTLRVGKFTVSNVECAVMPAEKGEIDPLLGQSFLKNFKVEFNPDAGKLTLKRVETADTGGPSAEAAPDRPAPRAMTKGRRPARQPRAPARSRRATPGRGAAAPAGEPPDGEPASPEPN